MKTMKKILCTLLVVIMCLTSAPLSGFVRLEFKAEAVDYKVGDIIQFGSYPQSKETDSATISALNAKAPSWDEWKSYGYYTGTGSECSMKQGDWMRYVDIKHDGERYRGVKFTQYRPYYTLYNSSSSNTYQDDNGYNTNTVYWFKFESIDWRVLDPSTGLVMCETIIDSQPYSNTIYSNGGGTYGYFNDASYKNYASDYETSSIRKWLNEDFYNTAFTDSEKKEISTTTLNNDGYYTSNGTTGYEKLDSNETKDKIFLLSYNEVRNSNFGFNSSSSAYDTARFGKGSDYAQSQGLYVYRSSGSTYNGNSYWLLRSPGYYSSYCCYVDIYGYSNYYYRVFFTILGVRPALKLKNLSAIQQENKIYSGEFYAEKYVFGGTDKYEGYRYTDDYFKGDNEVYNHDLAKMSLCVAMSAFNSKDSVNGIYYEDQDINIKYIFDEIGYNVKTYYYDEKPTTDSIAFAIGQKDIVIENENYTVIAIAVRGAGYEAEWGGNFRVGTGTDHEGFTLAKNKVITKLKEYINETKINHKVKFWLTGYSRAAATANLTAVEIINNGIGGATASDVYAYTFETPQNTKSKNAKSWKYDGIHNIVNPIDFVPKVAMSEWGYSRYGTDYFIPAAETSKEYNNLFKDMKKTYKNINKFDCPYKFEPKTLEVGFVTTKIVDDKNSNMKQTRFLDRFFNMLVWNTISTPEQYSKNLEDSIVKIISDLYVNEEDVNKFISGFKDVLIDFVLSHKMKVTEYLIKGIVAGNSTIVKLLLEDESIMEDFKKDIAKYMSSTKYLNLTYSEAKSFVDDCEDILHFLGVYEFDSVLTLISNFETAIAESHQPRLCLSWMNTLKSEADFSVGTYKTFVYNCPVDVSVYDSEGNLVAAIVDDVPIDLEESEFSYYINRDGEKVFCLPNDDEYNIVIEATDDGVLSCSISENSIESFESISKTCYNDISIKKGDILEQELIYDIDGEKEYGLTHNSQQVESTETYIDDAVVNYNVTVDSLGDGKAVGSGTRTVGSYAQLTALSSSCSKFEGWYIGEQCVSTDEVYRFRVENDVEILAKFSEKIYHNLSEWHEVAPATCETVGTEERYCSECDYSETQEIPATGHDFDGSGCNNCDYDRADDCSCNCHAGGIKGLIFKIILFFQKLFKKNRICEGCGVYHY